MIKILNILEEYELYRVFLDNNTSLLVDDEDIIKYQILTKKELSCTALNEIQNKNKKYECISDAFKLLNKKFYTTKEMNEKLSNKKYDSEIINNTIEYLVDNNYLNDEVYINDYVEFKINQGYGPLYIKNKLYQLGLNNNFNFTIEMQKEALRNYFLKSSYKINDEKTLEKVIAKLKKQGFYYDIIKEIYEEITKG
ncbi:MAG: recombination regulator RecX [Bacilli bacterium]|jgi:regulatory protein|nr:recombination regulator RecX [Bacilli bacterium]